MPLTPTQLQALPHLEWLFDPNRRREGRTFVTAVALIRLAARTPGQLIHSSAETKRQQDYLMQVVSDLAYSDPILEDNFHRQGYAFWFQPNMISIPNWLPRVADPLPGVVSTERLSLFDFLSED